MCDSPKLTVVVSMIMTEGEMPYVAFAFAPEWENEGGDKTPTYARVSPRDLLQLHVWSTWIFQTTREKLAPSAIPWELPRAS